MARPSRSDFNVKGVQGDASRVVWNCTKCGKSGFAVNRADAGREFDKHSCTA